MVLLCCWPQIIKFFVVVLISFSLLYFFTLVTDLLSLTFHAFFWSANIPYCLHHQDNSNCGFAGGASFCPSPTVIQMWPLADVGRAGDQEIKAPDEFPEQPATSWPGSCCWRALSAPWSLHGMAAHQEALFVWAPVSSQCWQICFFILQNSGKWVSYK